MDPEQPVEDAAIAWLIARLTAEPDGYGRRVLMRAWREHRGETRRKTTVGSVPCDAELDRAIDDLAGRRVGVRLAIKRGRSGDVYRLVQDEAQLLAVERERARVEQEEHDERLRSPTLGDAKWDGLSPSQKIAAKPQLLAAWREWNAPIACGGRGGIGPTPIPRVLDKLTEVQRLEEFELERARRRSGQPRAGRIDPTLMARLNR